MIYMHNFGFGLMILKRVTQEGLNPCTRNAFCNRNANRIVDTEKRRRGC
jgi:hypothetical protein